MKIYLSKNKIIQNIIMLLTIMLFSSFIIFDTYSKVSLILAGITSLILIFSILQNGISKKFKIGKYHLFVGIFALYCFLSSTWSVYPERAIEKGVTIFQLLICMSILYNYYSKFFSTEKLLKCISYSSVIISLYTIFILGIDNILIGLASGQRLKVDFANINSVSAVVSIGCVIIFYDLIYNKKYKYLFFMVINIFIIATSGSRTFLIIPILGCFLMVIIKNMRNRNYGANILKNIIFIIIFCFTVKLILELPVFNMINTRIEGLIASFTGHGEMEGSASMRKLMISLGWEQFKKTPFLGIGIGNSGPIILKGTKYDNSYLHNNFVEILSCGGIVGFFFYYNMYFYVFYKFIKNWKKKNDNLLKCFILCFCLFVADYGQVSYASKSTYFYFMVFFLCISELKKRRGILRKKMQNRII